VEAASTRVRPGRHEEIERLLEERGRSLGVGPARLAFGKSGIALGFPRDPMIHVSWWVVAAFAAVVFGLSRYRRRRSS
jgi:hypothetical protein